jgi:hypothetical protein
LSIGNRNVLYRFGVSDKKQHHEITLVVETNCSY